MTTDKIPKRCSYAEQYLWWVNEMPTRGTERLDEMDRWMDHFKAEKLVPIHTFTLNPDSLDVTRWWYEFFIELNVISRQDKIFKDLTCR